MATRTERTAVPPAHCAPARAMPRYVLLSHYLIWSLRQPIGEVPLSPLDGREAEATVPCSGTQALCRRGSDKRMDPKENQVKSHQAPGCAA